MPYTNYRKYVFCVPTACTIVSTTNPQDRPVVCGWDTGAVDASGVLPREVIENLRTKVSNDDMRVRLTRMLMAIEKSIEKERTRQTPPPGDTLRIFLAPEFYFRTTYQNQMRGYDYIEREFGELLTAFSFYFSEYKSLHGGVTLIDWVFLCGTCVHRENVNGFGVLVNDMVEVRIDSDGLRSIKLIRKLITSGIDGIFQLEDWNVLAASRLDLFAPMLKHHEIQPLGLSVEICLEHKTALATLSRSVAATNISVLSAAGMWYEDAEILAPSRLYLRADGMLQSKYELMVDSFMTDPSGRIPPDRRRGAVREIIWVDSTWRMCNPAAMGFRGYQVAGKVDMAPALFFMR